MVKFRVLKSKMGYTAGQVVDVQMQNVGLWLNRPWAERVKDEPETASIEAPEKAVKKGGRPRKVRRGDA